MIPFETILLEKIADAKAKLREDESLTGFTITINATGRLEADTEVSFIVGDYYGGNSVRAGTLDAALTEFLQRRRWQKRHAPLCLPNVETAGEEMANAETASDEIPF